MAVMVYGYWPKEAQPVGNLGAGDDSDAIAPVAQKCERTKDFWVGGAVNGLNSALNIINCAQLNRRKHNYNNN
jgi:hypothetical protein